jgi:cyclic pyranopterin phosphate synthase
MVSISSKIVTTRRATATGRIYLPWAAYDLLAHSPSGSNFKKGDVLGTARIAGIMAGKRTSELIPLCHPIGLTDLKVKFKLTACEQGDEKEGGWVGVEAVAECEGKTGVEVSWMSHGNTRVVVDPSSLFNPKMEALTSASTALLTVWDMVKAVAGKEMIIQDLMVVRKEGGKSGDWKRNNLDGSLEGGTCAEYDL